VTESQSPEKAGAKKGRPTPKRRDAERRPNSPGPLPKNRKEATKQNRTAAKAARSTYRRALRTGDERNLPPRDAGPVRRYVRDIVDARRNAGNYVLWVALGVVAVSTLATALPSLAFLRLLVVVAYPVMFVWVLTDSILLVRVVRRRVQEAFPAEQTRGLGGYAVMRTFQMRRFRLPPPRVRPGEKI
jgi:hypothetical protein